MVFFGKDFAAHLDTFVANIDIPGPAISRLAMSALFPQKEQVRS